MAADTAVLVSSYLDEKTITNSSITTLLESVAERQSLQGNGCSKEWVSKLNGYLNSNSDRWLGITLLGTTLHQCDTEVFTANCLSWMKIIQQILESTTSSPCLIQSSVKVLDDLMRYTIQFPDLMRNAANSTVPLIIPALLSLKDKDIVCCLTGISTCLKFFPGPSSTFKMQIENCVITCLDSSNARIRKHTAQCFALTAGCNNNTSDGKQKNTWEFQWSRVVNTIHATLDDLPGYDSQTNEDKINEVIPMDVITSEEPKKTNISTARVRCLLQCLEAMIRQGTKRVNTVPIDDTIKLIERLLAVNENTLKGSISLDVVLLKSCLPLIHISAMELLCSIIQRCGSLLLPYVSSLSTMLVRELSRTSDTQTISSQSSSLKPYSNLRCSVYNCFILWGELNASCNPTVIRDVICNILKDIKVAPNSQTKLNAPLQDLNKRGTSKGKKRKLHNLEQLTTNNKKAAPFSNASICHTALSTLSSVLINCGEFVPREIFQQVQVTLIGLVNLFQSGVPTPLPQPYDSPGCRKEGYHCLTTCVLARPSGAPSAINCVIRCLQQGLQDTHHAVSVYCREALMVVTGLIHPVVPSLDTPVQTMVSSQQNLPENHNSQHNGHLDETQYARGIELEPAFIPVGGEDRLPSSIHSGDREPRSENTMEEHQKNIRADMSSTSQDQCTEGLDKSEDKNISLDSDSTHTNNNNTPSLCFKTITNISGRANSLAEDQFKNSDSQKPVHNTSVAVSNISDDDDGDDDDDGGGSDNDDGDYMTAPVPSKKLKPDNQEYTSNDIPIDGTTSLNQEVINDSQDDVNEMLASFVNACPDSESE